MDNSIKMSTDTMHVMANSISKGACGDVMATTLTKGSKVLTMETINPNIKNVEYAIRGPIPQLASKLEKDLAAVSCGRYVFCL